MFVPEVVSFKENHNRLHRQLKQPSYLYESYFGIEKYALIRLVQTYVFKSHDYENDSDDDVIKTYRHEAIPLCFSRTKSCARYTRFVHAAWTSENNPLTNLQPPNVVMCVRGELGELL